MNEVTEFNTNYKVARFVTYGAIDLKLSTYLPPGSYHLPYQHLVRYISCLCHQGAETENSKCAFGPAMLRLRPFPICICIIKFIIKKKKKKCAITPKLMTGLYSIPQTFLFSMSQRSKFSVQITNLPH
jgi:hypothetical protein